MASPPPCGDAALLDTLGEVRFSGVAGLTGAEITGARMTEAALDVRGAAAGEARRAEARALAVERAAPRALPVERAVLPALTADRVERAAADPLLRARADDAEPRASARTRTTLLRFEAFLPGRARLGLLGDWAKRAHTAGRVDEGATTVAPDLLALNFMTIAKKRTNSGDGTMRILEND